MFFNFKKNNLDCEKIYTIKPKYVSSDFMRLLNLLSDENILLTFDEKDELYKHIDFIINFLEDKRNEKNDFRC